MDVGQGDDRLPGTDRRLNDVAMVPHILMAGLKSTSYKIKGSYRTLTRATLEMQILNQCGESTLKDFKPSPMNHGKGSVVEQLVPVENVFLMTSIRDLITQEGAAVACGKRRDALCFLGFMIKQISLPALNTCVKMQREGDEGAKALLLLTLLDIHQSKPMRVNMKELVELEPMKKIDEIRRFSNKEMKLTKESMGALPKSSEYSGPIRKKSYSYVSGIIGMAYNPFVNEECAIASLTTSTSSVAKIATIGRDANQQTKLGPVLEEKVTAPSLPKSTTEWSLD